MVWARVCNYGRTVLRIITRGTLTARDNARAQIRKHAWSFWKRREERIAVADWPFRSKSHQTCLNCALHGSIQSIKPFAERLQLSPGSLGGVGSDTTNDAKTHH